MSKSKEELQDELEDLKVKREEEEELATLKSNIKEEKSKISNAKYGSFFNAIKKVGKALSDAGSKLSELEQKKPKKKGKQKDINEELKRAF